MNYYELLRTIREIQKDIDNGDKHERIDTDLKNDIECHLSHLAYCIVTSDGIDQILKDHYEMAEALMVVAEYECCDYGYAKAFDIAECVVNQNNMESEDENGNSKK